jgi:acetate kinase
MNNVLITEAVLPAYQEYVKLDAEKNNKVRGEEAIISTPDSKVTVAVVPTDEELMIATDTEEIVSAL